jgi:hypothetical protein
MKYLLLACAVITTGCVATTQRNLVQSAMFDASTGTMWLVEKDTHSDVNDEIAVLVCHREASPACVRVIPRDMRDSGEYSRWLDTLPAEVRKLAVQPGTGVVVAPDAPQEQP